MRRCIRGFFLAIGVGLLGSCGGGGGDLTAASGSVDEVLMKSLMASSAATAFTDSIGSMKVDGSTKVSLPFSNLDASVGKKDLRQAAGLFDNCTTVSGSKADADGDGVAVNYRQDFNCTSIPDSGSLVSQNGFYREQDFDDTKYGIAGGYEFEFELQHLYEASHEVNTGAWAGLWRVLRTGTSYEMSNKYRAVSSSVPTDPSQGLSEFEWQADWATVYTPEDMLQPWVKGKLKNDGFFRVTGKYTDQGTKELHEINVVFRLEAKGLTYDRVACGGFFKDGTISFFDVTGNELRYTYTNCTEARTFNGKTL